MVFAEIDRQALVAFPVVRDPAPLRWFRQPPSSQTHLVVLSGSFNPPTAAHTALLRAAADFVSGWPVYLLPVKAIDKEDVAVLRVEDRLALLAQADNAAIAVTSAGLYVDQASAFHSLSPETTLSFVIGYDKLVQILDPRYYDDRDVALDTLFELAHLLVSPRGEQDSAAVTQTIETHGHRWRQAITLLPPPTSLDSTLSSSAVRAMPPEELGDEVDDRVKKFLLRWHPFQNQAAYLDRWTRLDGRRT